MSKVSYNQHCGHDWPHKPHEWLPDYPHALWESCPGSPDPETSGQAPQRHGHAEPSQQED